MPSASPRFDFSGYFKVFILQARWFIVIGTLYNSLFLQSALQSFFSPYCVPCLPSPATIIGFGGGNTSFPREKKMLFLIWGTCWAFTFVSPLLSSSWSHSLRPHHLLFLCSYSDLHSFVPHLCPQIPSSPLVLVPHPQLDHSVTSGLQLDVCPWDVGIRSSLARLLLNTLGPRTWYNASDERSLQW